MLVKKEYHEVILIGKKRRKSKLKIFLLFFTIFCGIFFAIFFTLKSLFFVPKTDTQNYYLIYTNIDAKTYETAEAKAVEFKARGGAGVVIKNDTNFGVVLAVYPTEKSALVVAKQLDEQGISTQVKALRLPIFSLNNMTDDEVQITTTINQKYHETLQNLYELSYNLDTNEISQSYTLMRINELALLWEQRAEILAHKINSASDGENKKSNHPLHPIYRLSLYVASQLKYLANENTYQDSLKTLISVIRQTNYMLCVLGN